MSKEHEKRAREDMRTKDPASGELLTPMLPTTFYTTTDALAAMYAPTEGAAA
jgi:hypothetical protein